MTSTVSVRSSAGNSRLGRLNVSFSLPVLAFQADDGRFRRKCFGQDAGDRRGELVPVELVAVAPVGGGKADRAIHLDDAAGPAGGDHAGLRLELRDQGGGALRIDADVDGLLAGAQRVAGDGQAG